MQSGQKRLLPFQASGMMSAFTSGPSDPQLQILGQKQKRLDGLRSWSQKASASGTLNCIILRREMQTDVSEAQKSIHWVIKCHDEQVRAHLPGLQV